MFNKLLNVTLVGFLVNRYGAMIVSTLVLFAYFWVVGLIHRDYLDYLELQGGSQGVGLSFVFKWLAFIVGIILYWLFNSYVRKKADRKRNTQSSSSLKAAGLRANKSAVNTQASADTEADDPFAEIRQKEKLRSRADIVIESKLPVTSKKQIGKPT